MALTGKQKVFVSAYFACGMNATEAARQAGYEGNEVTLASVGYENLRKPQIQAEIDRVLAERAMPANEVLARLTEQARLDLNDFYDVESPTLVFANLEKAKARGKLSLIKTISYTDRGQLLLEFHDRFAALVQLGRHHKLFTDKTEITDLRHLSDDELDAGIKALERGETPAAPSQGDNRTV